MSPDFEALKFVLALINTIGIAIVGVYSWWSNRDKATSDAIQGVRTDLTEQIVTLADDVRTIAARVSEVEHDVGERLKLADLNTLFDKLAQLNREMGELNAELRASRAQLAMHQEYLMTNGGLLRL